MLVAYLRLIPVTEAESAGKGAATGRGSAQGAGNVHGHDLPALLPVCAARRTEGMCIQDLQCKMREFMGPPTVLDKNLHHT